MVKNNGKRKHEPKRYRINDEIRWRGDVRLIVDGDARIVGISEARATAKEMGLDLIAIDMDATPPVCKIASYEKMMYNLKKAAKSNKSVQSKVKEIQLTTNIASNDLTTKANNARRFIKGGHRVKVVLSMRGRELSRREESKRCLFEFVAMLDDVCVPESQPRDDRNRAIVFLKKK